MPVQTLESGSTPSADCVPCPIKPGCVGLSTDGAPICALNAPPADQRLIMKLPESTTYTSPFGAAATPWGASRNVPFMFLPPHENRKLLLASNLSSRKA